jgi:hypothetical protein
MDFTVGLPDVALPPLGEEAAMVVEAGAFCDGFVGAEA